MPRKISSAEGFPPFGGESSSLPLCHTSFSCFRRSLSPLHTTKKTQQQTIQVGNDGAFRHTTHSDVDASSRWFFDFWLFFPLFKKLGDKRFTCQQEPGPYLGEFFTSVASHKRPPIPHTCTTSSALITFLSHRTSPFRLAFPVGEVRLDARCRRVMMSLLCNPPLVVFHKTLGPQLIGESTQSMRSS